MNTRTLADLDLNLLVALDVLLEERSVTRAAERIGVTQSAMSQTLGRLRLAFSDPLLVRAGRGMVCTSLAEGLAEPLHHVLSQLEELVRDPGPSMPATSTRTFRLACLDHFSAIHLPELLGSIHREAPGVDLIVSQLAHDALTTHLERGVVDAVVGVFRGAPAGLMQRQVHRERFVCMLRPENPVLKDWGLDTFAAASHGLLSTTGRGPGVIDYALSTMDRERRVAVRLPHFLAAGPLAARTDLVFTVASRLGAYFAERFDVVLIEPPFDLPEYPVVLRWHRRSQNDPVHRWFREKVVDSAR